MQLNPSWVFRIKLLDLLVLPKLVPLLNLQKRHLILQMPATPMQTLRPQMLLPTIRSNGFDAECG